MFLRCQSSSHWWLMSTTFYREKGSGCRGFFSFEFLTLGSTFHSQLIRLSYRLGMPQVEARSTFSMSWKHINDIMVILVCSTQWKWEGQVRTRPYFIQNRPGQIFSSHVSMYFGGWLLHNKNQPVLHGNSSAGSSIKQHKDESFVFGLHIYPFFCFLMEGQFGCGWWNSSVRARPQKSARSVSSGNCYWWLPN